MSSRRDSRRSDGPSFEGLEARRLLSGCMFPFSVEFGTRGDDEIIGSDARDIIVGKSGDDDLFGMDGNDVLVGGRGADLLNGGAGNDRLIAGPGDDIILGGFGSDKVNGGSGNDTIRHSIMDQFPGDADRYRGNSGQDTLVIDLTGVTPEQAEDIQTTVTEAFDARRRSGRVNFDRLGIDGLNVRVKGIETIEFELPAVQITEPPVVEDDILSVFEGGAITFPTPGALVNDVDPEGQPLFVSAVNGVEADVGQVITLASGATLQMDADGQFVYDSNSAFDYLTAGETGEETFTYTAADGEGGFATATVTIWIFGL